MNRLLGTSALSVLVHGGVVFVLATQTRIDDVLPRALEVTLSAAVGKASGHESRSPHLRSERAPAARATQGRGTPPRAMVARPLPASGDRSAASPSDVRPPEASRTGGEVKDDAHPASRERADGGGDGATLVGARGDRPGSEGSGVGPWASLAMPRYRDNAKPAYPWLARRRGEQGTVVLSVLVTERGRVGHVRVAESSGSPALDEAALAAITRWTFHPSRRGTEPTASWVRVPIRFRLED